MVPEEWIVKKKLWIIVFKVLRLKHVRDGAGKMHEIHFYRLEIQKVAVELPEIRDQHIIQALPV